MKKGITLVELIISISILIIVIAVGYLIFSYCNKIYGFGTKQYNIQANIRLANSYIDNQLKYSSYILINTDSNPAIPQQNELDPYENYIYYDSASQSIIHLNRFFKKSFNICPADKDGASGDILFESYAPEYKSIYFRIHAKDGNQQYQVENTIDLLNIHLSNTGKVDGTITANKISGYMIKYKTPSDYLASQLKPSPEIDTNNEKELKFHCVYNQDGTPLTLEVSSVSILEPFDITSPNVTVNSLTTLDYICETHLNDAKLYIEVKFSNTQFQNDTYIYVLEYDKDSNLWTIR